MNKPLIREAINFMAPEVYVFNIKNNVQIDLIEQLILCGYKGIEYFIGINNIDFSYRFHKISIPIDVTIENDKTNGTMEIINKFSLYIHSAKMKKDRRIRKLIRKYLSMDK